MRDRWACYAPEFGFRVYDEPRAAANQEVDSALETLLGSFRNDLTAISQFLDKRSVKHIIRP